MRNGEPGGQWWYDEPGEQAPNYPVAFPGPALNLFVRYIKTARRKAADEMEYDTKNDKLHKIGSDL
jgi:hypothetical protein